MKITSKEWTYKTKNVEKEHKEEARADETMEEEEVEGAQFPLVTHVNNILRSFFPNFQVYINNQQIYNSNGLYAHTSYISNNFTGAISEYKQGLHCKRYDYEASLDENMEPHLYESFLGRLILGRPI